MNESPCAVTGAAGFIGRRVVRALLEDGRPVRALVRDPAALADITHPRLTVRAWRIEEARADRDALADVRTVFHLAAYVPGNHRDPACASDCLRVNAQGTLDLLQAAEDGGVARVVYFSAGNIFARGQADEFAETAVRLQSTHSPYYLSSKLVGEVYCDHFRQMRSLSVSMLRISAVYGPGMGERGMIPVFAARLSNGQGIEVHDGGRYTVDLVHADDVADAAIRAAAADQDGIFNIGSGAESTVLQVAHTMSELLQVDPDTAIHVQPADPDTPGPGFAGLDIQRARDLLGYAPRSLRAGIAHYLHDRGLFKDLQPDPQPGPKA